MATNHIGSYQYDKIFEQTLRRLRLADEISDEDKVSIAKLVDYLLAKGVSKQRAIKYVNHLIVAAKSAGKPLNQAGKKDIGMLVSQINTANYTEHTKHDYMIIIKKYFQWLRGCDENQHEYPEEVGWIKTTFRKKRLLPEALLSVEELKKLVDAAENQRDRAFILTHYESGCARAHEDEPIQFS